MPYPLTPQHPRTHNPCHARTTPPPHHPTQQMHKSHFRMVIDYGRYIYRFSAIGYSAIQLYENPWVVRAVATAVWASGKLAWGALGMLL